MQKEWMVSRRTGFLSFCIFEETLENLFEFVLGTLVLVRIPNHDEAKYVLFAIVRAPMWIGWSNVFNSIKDASMHLDGNAI